MQIQFQHHIKQTFPFLEGKTLLLAVSGGLDSVVLTHLLHLSGYTIALAHCNFNLRGAESDADEAFVEDLGNALGVEVFVQHFDTTGYAEANKLSIQVAARELRYNWFHDLAEQLGYHYIVTAHHADDALETFLINLSRGTGLKGLTGIPEVNESIVRPLLPFSRQTILDYAKANAIHWREDSSNTSTKYLRNALRHNVIPELKTVSPQFLDNFKETLQHLEGINQVVENHINEVLKKCIEKTENDTIYFSTQVLKLLNPQLTYLHHIFQPYQFTDIIAIQNLLTAQSGKQVFSNGYSLLKNRGHIILKPIVKDKFEEVLIFEDTQEINVNNQSISIENVTEIQKNDSSVIFIDKSKIKYPLKIRKWRKGDYFCPFGMRGAKKLSKYFKDEKLSLIDKENVLLLCSNNNIVWVINYRLDNRFKVSNSTKSILKISCST